MRIASLHLKAYGPFDGAVLDLERPAAGLQVVYGPNERGKSSAMRAIAALLFGFPVRTDDAHQRDYAALRVGAVLDDGVSRRALMRRKGVRNTLFEFDPATGEERADRVVDASAVDALLGGIDERRFLAMHALDAERLRAGGRALATAGGELGALIFEAASGLVRLRAVSDALQLEADALFVPRGQKPTLNATLAELEVRRRQARDAGTRPLEWSKLRAEHDDVERALRDSEEALRDSRRRLAHRERILGLLPQVVRLEGLAARLAALSAAPLLAADAAERLAEWRRAQADSDAAIAEIDADLAQQRMALEDLTVSQPHLDAAAEIVRLAARLDEHAADRAALPAVRSRARDCLDALLRSLRTLDPEIAGSRGTRGTGGIGADTDTDTDTDTNSDDRDDAPSDWARLAAEALPARARIASARALLDARSADEVRGRVARSELAEAEREQVGARRALDASTRPVALAVVEAAVESASAAGELEQRISTLRARLESADAGLARLATMLGDADPVRVAAYRLPPAAACERADAQARELERTRAGASDRRRAAAAELEAACADRDARIAQRPISGQGDLEAARLSRDALVDEAGGALAAGERPAAARALAGLPSAIAQADRLADARLEDASRVAEIESLARRIRAHHASIADADETLAMLATQARAAEVDWRSVLDAHGLPMVALDGWRDWIATHDRLRDALGPREAVAVELRAARLEADRLETALTAALRAADATGPVAVGLAPSLAQARRWLDTAKTAANEHVRALEALRRGERAVAQRRDALRAIDAELADREARWSESAIALGLSADASAAALAERIEALETLRESLSTHEAADRDHRAIVGRARTFERDARALVVRLGTGLADDADAADAVARCAAALEAARGQAERRTVLRARVDALSRDRDSRVRALADARAGLASLRAQAGVEGFEALQDAVSRSAMRRELVREADGAQATLRETTGAQHDVLLAEASGADADTLRGDIDALRGIVDEQERERDGLLARREQLRGELHAIDGDAIAAHAADEVRERLAAAGRLALDWSRLKLARDLLDQAVQRHAQRAQGPMLAAAARWFERLTAGLWRDLRVEFEGDAQVLAAERADGARLRVGQLSEGAADGLFLALRLAAIEVRLGAAPPVPLLLDDVLASFDDDRAALALQALAELGERNQVVYFTHHAHLVELARRAVPAHRVAVNELERHRAAV